MELLLLFPGVLLQAWLLEFSLVNHHSISDVNSEILVADWGVRNFLFLLEKIQHKTNAYFFSSSFFWAWGIKFSSSLSFILL